MIQILIVTFFLALMSCTPTPKNSERVETSIRTNIKGLDPAFASDNISLNAISQIYEGLYHFNNRARPLEIEPLLAKSLPQISKDGLTYKIELKEGVYFSSPEVFKSGKRELVASDFIYSMKRLLDPRSPTPGAPVYKEIIEGAEKWRADVIKDGQNFNNGFAGLVASDRYSLSIRLTRPLSHFVQLLTLPFAMIVPVEALNTTGEISIPILPAQVLMSLVNGRKEHLSN